MARKRRGASGGGTIRQRPDGRWEARITIGHDPVTGKQKQRSFYGKTQKEVRQKLQQAAVELDAGTYIEPSRMTLDQWLELWLTEYKTSIRDSSRMAYRSLFRTQISPYIGNLPLQRITPIVLQRYFNDLISRMKLSSATVVKSILHSSFSKAVSVGHLRSNPVEKVDLPSSPPPEIKPLSSSELVALLNYLDGKPLYYPVALCLFA